MHLILFDIDGTITDSTKVDDECFIQSFQDLHKIDLKEASWSDFKHVTDSGLTFEIFEQHLDRQPSEEEISVLKRHFYTLLHLRKREIREIEGALNAIKFFTESQSFAVAFATGGWKETAVLKLSAIGLDPNEYILISASEHQSRAAITQLAIETSRKQYKLQAFESMTYIGDGLWDYQTTKELGINFIGIDYQQNNRLRAAGAPRVLVDLIDIEKFFRRTDSSSDV